MVSCAWRQERKQAERAGRKGGAGERRASQEVPKEAGMREKDALMSQVRAFQRLHPDDRHSLLTDKARRGLFSSVMPSLVLLLLPFVLLCSAASITFLANLHVATAFLHGQMQGARERVRRLGMKHRQSVPALDWALAADAASAILRGAKLLHGGYGGAAPGAAEAGQKSQDAKSSSVRASCPTNPFKCAFLLLVHAFTFQRIYLMEQKKQLQHRCICLFRLLCCKQASRHAAVSQ